MERKVEEEGNARLRAEDDIRGWFEQKFSLMMERLTFEERGQLDRERRIMQSLQEGLQALADIVRGVKEQMGLGLAEVHNLTLENITEVSKKNEVIRDSIFQRQSQLEAALADTQGKLEELSEQSFKHAKSVNETLNREAARMEKISSAMEKHTLGQLSELKSSIQAYDEKVERWRVNFEDAESKKLLELHSAMKILNSNFQKVSRDSKDRFELLQKEFQAFDNALRNQIFDVRHKVEVELRGIEERTETTIGKYFVKLQNGGSLTGLVGSSSNINNLELDMLLNELKEEMKAYTERVVFQNSEKLIEQRHSSEMLLEGRCNAFSVELERKYREMYMQYKAELELADTERKLRVKSEQSEMIDQFQKIRSDVTLRLELFESKEQENKMWVER